jgi:hypothetical protein
MKTKDVKKALVLNKKTITNLTNQELQKLYAGGETNKTCPTDIRLSCLSRCASCYCPI